MNCSGQDVRSGKAFEVAFHDVIETVTDASAEPGVYLAPGWIDIQVNGFAGVDYNNAATTHAEIARSIQAQFSTGVTRFYPTVITGPPDAMAGALRNLAAARESLPDGEAMDGFHVEGPHICAEEGPRGAHPRQWVRRPDIAEYEGWQEACGGRVRIVTLSPEWPEASAYIARITRDGVVAAIGHTQASAAQIAEAVDAGATLSTHLGNGAHGVMRRHPNYIWDQLAEDRLMADFIVDGIHLDTAFLKVAMRAKTVERSVLVTDAAPPAMAAPGRYYIGEQAVDLTSDERVVLAGQDRLAGSALRMDRAIGNTMRMAGVPLADAVQMATVNAARAGRVPGRAAGLTAGERADLVTFRMRAGAVEVVRVWMSGHVVFG